MALCNPYQQWLDNNGRPLAGGRLYAYLAGTTTPTPTWRDAGFGILNTNPVVLDSAGYSMVWLNPAAVYKFRMTNRWGVQQWTVDNVSGNLLCAPSGGGPTEPSGPPTIISITPNSGPVAGGNQVTITGTNFDISATVAFNGTSATNVGVLSLTTLMATVPPGNPGTVSVTVTVNGQPVTLANAYTYGALPTVTTISPVTGSTGTVVTITGTNFSSGAAVTFGGIPATAVTVVNATTITATVPAGTGAVTVTVTQAGQSATSPIAFTYVAPGPTVTVISIAPASGSANGGTAVTITGTNFALGATVTIGGVSATNVVVASTTSITATTPAGTAGTATVSVTAGGQVGSLPNAFTYIAVPTVTLVTPNTGPTSVATPVVITGTNFANPATVTFAGTAATAVNATSATSINATTPARAIAGLVAVAVTVNTQTGTLNNAYNFVAPAQPIYSTLGPQGATGVLFDGTNLDLDPYTGNIFTVLQNSPETVGQTFGPFTPTDQCIYLLLRGGSRTFLDQNNRPFAMDAPIAVTVSGATMYLYASSNLLYFTWTITVQS